MKKLTNLIVAVAVLFAGVVPTQFAKACSGSECSVSDSHGYYKKVIIKKVRTIEKSCTGSCVQTAPPVCRRCGVYRPFYRGWGTRFTGGPLQFRWGQPVRNILRVPARLGVRAASLVGGVLRGVGRVLFPRRFF